MIYSRFSLATLTALSLFAPLSVQAAVPAPEAMVQRHIPAISDTIKTDVDQYRNVRAAAFVDWYPDGEGLLMTTRFGNTYQLHQMLAPGGRREQKTFFEEPVTNGSFSPTNAEHLLFTKDVGGSENYQLFHLNIRNGKSMMISDGKSRNGGALWSPDGQHFVYNSTQRNNKDNDIYLASVDNPKSARRLFEGEGYWVAVDWSDDGENILLFNYISAQKSQYYLVNVKTGKSTNLFPQKNGKISFGDGILSKDGKGLYYTSDEQGDFKQLYYREFATGKTTALTPHLKWDITNMVRTHNGTHLAFTTNEDGRGQLRLFDTETGTLTHLKNIPVGQISRLSFSPDDKKIALTLSTSKAPADVYTLNLESMKAPALMRWTYSEVGGLDTRNFPAAQLIRYPSFDGLDIPAFYYHPTTKNQKKAPVIIMIHGGPEGQYRPSFSSRTQYWLNELGIAVIAPNVRGSRGYGKAYLAMDNGYKREDSVKDIGALLDWIKTQPQLDAERVAVYGGSYGGYMVLASLIHYGDRLKAGVDSVGISNFVTFLKNTKAYRRDLRRVEYGDERDPKMRAFLERISPTNHADKIKSPLLVVQGLNDPRVPASEAEQIAAAVEKQGTPLWFLMAKDEGHGFRKKPNRDYLEYVVASFWQKYLLE